MTGIRAVAVIVGIAVTLAGCGGSPARPARRTAATTSTGATPPPCTRTWVRSPATCGPATWTAPTPTGPCRGCSRARPGARRRPGSAPRRLVRSGARRSSRWASTRATRGGSGRSTTPSTRRRRCTSTPSTCSTCHPAIRSRRRCTGAARAGRSSSSTVRRVAAAAVGRRGGRTAIQRGAVHPGGRHRRAHGPAVSVSEPVPGPLHRGRRRRGGAAAGPADARAG